MNLQTLRDTISYGTFRTIASGFAIVLIVVGVLTAVAGMGVIMSLGWAGVPAILSGAIIIASGMVAREAAHLVADIPDLLI